MKSQRELQFKILLRSSFSDREKSIHTQHQFSLHRLSNLNKFYAIITKALLPTPPEPRTTSLYSRILGRKLHFDTYNMNIKLRHRHGTNECFDAKTSNSSRVTAK